MNGKESGAFSRLNPITLAVYFVSVLAVAMFTVNPIFVALTFLGGILYYSIISDIKKLPSNLFGYFVLMLVLTLSNPIFSHHGETPLFFMNGKPVTLEAIIYGFVMSVTVVSVLMWCAGLSKCFSSDKIIYLFGKPFPKLAMVISMALRFIPLFKEEYKKISDSQKTLGMFSSSAVTDRIMSVIKTFSALVTWILENSIDSANSMKSRGYGLKNRTSFSLFKFTSRDSIVLFLNIVLISVAMCSVIDKSAYFYFYPTVSQVPLNANAVISYIAYAVLVMIPFIIEIKEVLVWKFSMSKI